MIKQQKFELLSALLDGENIPDDQLSALLADPEVMQKWNQYTMERAVIKGEMPDAFDCNFADKVTAAIDKEPTIKTTPIAFDKAAPIAFDQVANEPEVMSEQQVQRNAKKRFSNFFHSVRQGARQVAIAASVACICVFGAQMYNNTQPNSTFNQQSLMSANGLAMSPVTNTAPIAQTKLNVEPQTMKVVTPANIVPQVAQHSVEAQQLREMEHRKAVEIRTIDALLNDHAMMKRTKVYN